MTEPVDVAIAVKLKDKSFDVPTANYYLKSDSFLHEGFMGDYWGDYRKFNWNHENVGIKPFIGFTSAPTIAEVIQWMYKKHSLWIVIIPTICGYFTYKILDVQLNPEHEIERPPYKDVCGEDFYTPDEAYLSAINDILDNII